MYNMYNMAIKMTTSKDIARWIVSNRKAPTVYFGLEVARIKNQSPTSASSVRIFLDKNDNKYTCFCEDEYEARYGEVIIELNDKDIRVGTCRPFDFEAIFNYIAERITKKFI